HMPMKRILYLALFVTINWCCSRSGTNCCVPPPNPPGNNNIAKGVDVSWLSEMEAAGRKFYNSGGTEKECMQLLKDLGANSIRLRVWVNPANGWNNSADVLTKATRAKNLGLKLLID